MIVALKAKILSMSIPESVKKLPVAQKIMTKDSRNGWLLSLEQMQMLYKDLWKLSEIYYLILSNP